MGGGRAEKDGGCAVIETKHRAGAALRTALGLASKHKACRSPPRHCSARAHDEKTYEALGAVGQADTGPRDALTARSQRAYFADRGDAVGLNETGRAWTRLQRIEP